MHKKFIRVSVIAALCFVAPAYAESFEEMCLRVSDEWGSGGDVEAQCSCLAGLAAGDQTLADEITGLAETYSNDAEAYDAASASGKLAFDKCNVET